MKIAVIGTGAMGSIYAARLAIGGHQVWATDTWADHISAIQADGLRVDGPDGTHVTQAVIAAQTLGDAPACDLYIVATKADGVAAAAHSVARHRMGDAPVLTIQNGLGAGDRLAEHVPRDAILLGIAEAFGASMVGPGHVTHSAMKRIRIGDLSGGITPRLSAVAQAWEAGGFPVSVEADIDRLIWEKFLCNVTLSAPCTAFDCSVSELLADARAWAVALGAMSEAWAVGQARGVAFSFEDPVAYVTAFAQRVGGASPSMRQDHLAGRRSELDAINGQVPKLARDLGLATPYNDTLCAVLRAREATFP